MQYIVLPKRQRRNFFMFAALCAGLSLLAVPALLAEHDLGTVIEVGLWSGLMLTLTGYYIRTAYGWIQIDHDGLRTSRLIRGRRLRWADITSVRTRTYFGKGSQVTVAVVRTRSGRAYRLPAPRTTEFSDDEFKRTVRLLKQYANGRRTPPR